VARRGPGAGALDVAAGAAAAELARRRRAPGRKLALPAAAELAGVLDQTQPLDERGRRRAELAGLVLLVEWFVTGGKFGDGVYRSR
jgi:hypothetical protein